MTYYLCKCSEINCGSPGVLPHGWLEGSRTTLHAVVTFRYKLRTGRSYLDKSRIFRRLGLVCHQDLLVTCRVVSGAGN